MKNTWKDEKGNTKTIAIFWNKEDIIEEAHDAFNVEITDEQAGKILDDMLHHHDSEIGINWYVIEAYIEDFLYQEEIL